MNNRIRSSLYSRKKGSKGLFKSDTGLTEFWKHYYQSKKPIPYSKAQLVLKDLLKGYMEILRESEYFYIPYLGYFSIILTEKKNLKRKHVDWLKTYDLWKEQWPNLTAEEYKEIPNKPLVYFRNKIGVSRGLSVAWWKMRKRQLFYTFDPTTLFKKELGRLANKSDEFTFPSMESFLIKVGAAQEETMEIRKKRENVKR